MFTSKLYVRNSHLCFMNWIIPSSRAIFVRRTTKIARDLKTDKRSLQLKKKTHHERKHKVQGSEGKYSHHTWESQASSGSFPYNDHPWLKITEQFQYFLLSRNFLKKNVYNHISRYLTENMILSNNWFFIRDAECLLLADDTSIFY